VKIEYEEEGRSTKTLGEWILGGEIPLMLKGGGVFYITVYSVRGRGDWACMFYPVGEKPTDYSIPTKPAIPTKPDHDHDENHHGGSQNIVGTWEIIGLSGTGMERITLTFNSDGTWIHMADTAADKPFYYSGTYKKIGNTIKMKTLYSRSEGENWISLESFNLTSEAKIEGNKLTYSESGGFTYTRQ